MSRVCDVKGCFNKCNTMGKGKQRHPFKLPIDWNWKIMWMDLIGYDELPSNISLEEIRVCASHFLPFMCRERRLIQFAIPTLKLPDANKLDKYRQMLCEASKMYNKIQSSDNIDLPTITNSQKNDTLVPVEELSFDTPYSYWSYFQYPLSSNCISSTPESTEYYENSSSDSDETINNEDCSFSFMDDTEIYVDQPEFEFDPLAKEVKTELNEVKIEYPDLECENLSEVDLFKQHMDIVKIEPEELPEETNILDVPFEPILVATKANKPITTYFSKRKREFVTTVDSNMSPNLGDTKKQKIFNISDLPEKFNKSDVTVNPEYINVIEGSTSENNKSTTDLLEKAQIERLSNRQILEETNVSTNEAANQEKDQINEEDTDSSPDGSKDSSDSTDFLKKFRDKLSRLHKIAKHKSNIRNRSKIQTRFQLLALNIYLSSHSLYKFLQKPIMLPPIEDCITKLKLESGVNDDIIKLMKLRMEDKPSSYKYCMITLKEFKIKENIYYNTNNDEIYGFTEIDGVKHEEIAKYALILSMKGCIEEYMQPLGYSFTGAAELLVELSEWLRKTIVKLREAGFVVCAVVSHHKNLFLNLAKSMGVAIDNPFFKIDDKEVFYIFDPRYLVKDLQENLFYYDFSYDENKLASWKYIESFYKFEKGRRIKMAPKVTVLHLKPHEGKDYYYGTQLLSYAVALGMSVAIEMGQLPPDAQGTVDFILKIDQLLDVLNSEKQVHPNKNLLKQEFSGSHSQFKCLNETLKTFKNIRALFSANGECRTNSVSSFFGIRVTVNAILQLYFLFRSKNILSLSTKRFNLDTTENFIAELNNVAKKPLTTFKFRDVFSSVLVNGLLKNPTENNFEVDVEHFFDNFFKTDKIENLFFKKQIVKQTKYVTNQTESKYCPLKSDRIRKLPTENMFDRACYLLFKSCIKTHSCSAFGKQDGNEELTPPKYFVNYVKILEDVFVERFEGVMLKAGVGANFSKVLEEKLIPFVRICPCFPVKRLTLIYFRLRMYQMSNACKNYFENNYDESIPAFVDLSRL